MSLLTRLGRMDGKNVQVKIFESAQDTEEREEEYQRFKQRIHQRIVEEMTPEEQRVLSSIHQDPRQVELIIEHYVEEVMAEDPFAIPRGERPQVVADIRDAVGDTTAITTGARVKRVSSTLTISSERSGWSPLRMAASSSEIRSRTGPA